MRVLTLTWLATTLGTRAADALGRWRVERRGWPGASEG
jgi:hypothetical protein